MRLSQLFFALVTVHAFVAMMTTEIALVSYHCIQSYVVFLGLGFGHGLLGAVVVLDHDHDHDHDHDPPVAVKVADGLGRYCVDAVVLTCCSFAGVKAKRKT
jgi:CRISPR/Cas system-associated endonuclease/helicase Cas3